MPGTTDLLKALYIIPMASSKCRALVPHRLAKYGCYWVMLWVGYFPNGLFLLNRSQSILDNLPLVIVLSCNETLDIKKTLHFGKFT